ncbi:hypothetical protein BJ165DRAFT_1328479, partial [Panaeolus papilionaceus]
ITTVHCELCRAGLSVKQVEKVAAKRDPLKCANFVCRISQHPTSCLLVLDEVSKDNRTYSQLWGRSPQGTPAAATQPFVWKRRFSKLATLSLDEGIVAAQVIEESFDHDHFIQYLQDDLVCITYFSSLRVL